MKKPFIILAILLCIALTAYAIVKPPYNQVGCNGTVTVINPSASFNNSYMHLVIMNQTPSVGGVYIGPDSSITTTNAPILLSSSTTVGYIADALPTEPMNLSWYCITSGATVTVGWLVRGNP
jgi:hypothetical protein